MKVLNTGDMSYADSHMPASGPGIDAGASSGAPRRSCPPVNLIFQYLVLTAVAVGPALALL